MFTYAVARDPGVAGYAMVSDRFLAVLAADAGDETALRLWHALSGDEPTLEAALATLSSPRAGAGAQAALPDFAVVELVDAPTRSVALAVRGAAGIELAGGGDVRTGEAPGAWTRSGAREVSGLTLRLRSSPATGRLPLGRGVVRADRLDWGAPSDRDTAAAVSEPPLQTLRRDRMPAAESAASAVDERTELSRARRRSAARPVLRLGADRVLELDRPVVLGRSPHPAAHPGARLVPLPSPQREISGTHLEVRLDGEALVATDLGSTNGTIVREPGGSAMLLRHGSTARLSPGSSLDLGDGAVAIFDLTADGGG